MKVLFVTNIPSPYRVNFFNELGKLCDLTVLFERASSAERDDSWKNFNAEHFKAIVLKGKSYGTDKAFCPEIVRYLKKGLYDRVIITNFSSFTGMLAILWLRMKKIQYFLESDGGFPKSGAGLKEKIKSFLIKDAAGYFSTGAIHDQYYIQYGAKPERLIRYPFTSSYRRDILEKPVTPEERTKARKKLGITETNVVLCIGQFIRRKGIDVLLNAAAKLAGDIGIYIVGGEPTQAYLNQVKQLGLESVHFVGFQPKDVLSNYFVASNVFVLPTREDIWGLVVNEAMAKGLPVVTTDRCVAGLELITDAALGCVVPVEDSEELAVAIENMLAKVTDETNAHVLKKISKYCFEEMAKRHIEALQKY